MPYGERTISVPEREEYHEVLLGILRHRLAPLLQELEKESPLQPHLQKASSSANVLVFYVHAWACMRMCECACARMCVGACECMSACVCLSVHACVCPCMRVYARAHVCM